MSTQLITNYFRLHNVNQFKESINEVANSVYYVFAGTHVPYSTGDANIPDLTNSVNQTLYDAYSEMVFGKRVSISDVSVVTQRHNWVSNTVYTPYSSANDLTGQPYFVVVDAGASFHVFKCLDNNGGVPSTVAPDVNVTSPDDQYYSTSDGYVWKYMYSVDSTTFNKFATDIYMPVIANTQVVANAVPGAVDVVTIVSGGSNYNTFLSNTFSAAALRIGGNPLKYNLADNANPANNFYIGSYLYVVDGTGVGQGKLITDYVVVGSSKTVTLDSAFAVALDATSKYEITPSVLITGDGSNAVARAIVNAESSNSISQVQIISRGAGYTYATAAVVGNTSGSTNAASLSIVLGPKGGHGSNPEYELGSSSLCISVTFGADETGTIPVANDYRSIGLLKDPQFAIVTLTVGSAVGSFTIGERVTQANTGATGIVTDWDSINQLTLTNVTGVFNTGGGASTSLTGAVSSATAVLVSYTINGASKNFNTFDQRHKYTFTPIAGAFIQDEKVFQTDISLANAYFHSNSSSSLYLTHIKGVLNTGNNIIGTVSGASANLLYHYAPDLVVGSGEVMYFENESPITRSLSQSETVKIILQF